VPLVYREGFSALDTATSGLGLGLTTAGVGVGLFGGRTKGVQQTALSSDLAPPHRKVAGKWVRLGFLLGVLIFLGAFAEPGAHSAANVVFGLVLAIPTARSWLRISRWNDTELPKLTKQWEDSFICTRCAHVFSSHPHHALPPA